VTLLVAIKRQTPGRRGGNHDIASAHNRALQQAPLAMGTIHATGPAVPQPTTATPWHTARPPTARLPQADPGMRRTLPANKAVTCNILITRHPLTRLLKWQRSNRHPNLGSSYHKSHHSTAPTCAAATDAAMAATTAAFTAAAEAPTAAWTATAAATAAIYH
jgi:hypothetical protein